MQNYFGSTLNRALSFSKETQPSRAFVVMFEQIIGLT